MIASGSGRQSAVVDSTEECMLLVNALRKGEDGEGHSRGEDIRTVEMLRSTCRAALRPAASGKSLLSLLSATGLY